MSAGGASGGRVGWVVDVQRDFMDPPGRGGRLYVHDLFDPSDPGAELARGAIVRAAAWMRGACDAVVFTGDWRARFERPLGEAWHARVAGLAPAPAAP